jgi:uncharacterized membrane protein
MKGTDPASRPWMWMARISILVVIGLFVVMTMRSKALRRASEPEVS